MSKKHPPQQHLPVLLEATLQVLRPRVGETYLDLTAGYGGHAGAFLQKTNAKGTLVDRDQNAVEHLKKLGLKNVEVLHKDFYSVAKELVDSNKTFDLVLADLGVSSPQLDIPERGFSFRLGGPLDMRMDPRQEKTAESIVNNASESEIADIIYRYGEEKPKTARAIARAIVVNRPLSTTEELAGIVKQTVRSKGKIHPATRTFQALRIATNDELVQISNMLQLLPKLLNPNGRVGIISFHSLEDRLVKRYLKEQKDMGLEAELEPLLKRPIKGSDGDVHNPRARSAVLRAAVKINTKKGKDFTR